MQRSEQQLHHAGVAPKLVSAAQNVRGGALPARIPRFDASVSASPFSACNDAATSFERDGPRYLTFEADKIASIDELCDNHGAMVQLRLAQWAPLVCYVPGVAERCTIGMCPKLFEASDISGKDPLSRLCERAAARLRTSH